MLFNNPVRLPLLAPTWSLPNSAMIEIVTGKDSEGRRLCKMPERAGQRLSDINLFVSERSVHYE